MIDVGDRDRPPLGRDPAREPAADRDPHTLLDLLLDALRRARVQLVALQHQDRDGVDRHDLGDPPQQLLQQLLLGQVRERGIRHPLQRRQPARGALGRLACEALASEDALVLDGERGAVGGELEQVARRRR